MDAIYILDIVGTFAFAISGVSAAVERKFDLFGTVILAFVTAVGGGTLRDLLIGSTPVSWMTSDIHIWVVLSAIPIAFFFNQSLVRMRKTFFVFDTLGIGLFTVLGVQKSLELGLSPAIAVMMGVISAVFGGVIRDVLSSQVPLIFRKEIYAFACLSGALAYLIMDSIGVVEIPKIVISISVIIAVRILAVVFKWSIPFRPLGKSE